MKKIYLVIYTDEYGNMAGPHSACLTLEKANTECERLLKEQDEDEVVDDWDKYHYYVSEVNLVE